MDKLFGRQDQASSRGIKQASRTPVASKQRNIAAKSSQDSVRAVDRALEILLAFSAGDQELAVSDLLERVDLSRPTLYRLLDTLEQNRFLISTGEPRRFRLGPAVAQLAHVWNAGLDIAAIAEPLMRVVWAETDETVALFQRDGLYRLCVSEMASPQALSFKRGIGYRESLAVGASGRAILAWINPVADDLKAYGSLKTDVDSYLAELARVRKRGYAVSRHELLQGAVAVAAPFFNGAGQVMGSLGVFGPDARLSQAVADRFGELLVRQAQELSRMLGAKA